MLLELEFPLTTEQVFPLSKRVKLFFLTIFCTSFGFVMLSGNKMAHLDVSPEQPIAYFHWNGSSPTIRDRNILVGGEVFEDKDAMRAIIESALQAWSQIPGSYIELKLVEDGESKIDDSDKKNVISVVSSKELTSVAFAHPIIEKSLIVDCDITVFDKETTVKQLTLTITHELGHCLGLGHPHTNSQSIMSYTFTGSQAKLGADDMAGIMYLYFDVQYGTPPTPDIECGGSKDSQVAWLGFMLPWGLPSFGKIYRSLRRTRLRKLGQ